MKTQMRFQKYLCLAMLIVGALALLYAFCYCTGSLAELGQSIDSVTKMSYFEAAEGKNDALLYNEIQGFNNALMYCGIVMILLAVLLYITACHSRRNYYISNYIATVVCAGGNIIMSVILIIMNGIWKGKFLNVDFQAWNDCWAELVEIGEITGSSVTVHYSESTVWFDIGFIVYAIVIVASILLLLNLVWKIKLMQGEKKLLNGNQVAGGATV